MLQTMKPIACGLAVVLLCSCADMHGRLSSSTERLEHSTSAMAHNAQSAPVAPVADDVAPADDTGRPYTDADHTYVHAYERDTHALAVDAQALRRVVEEGSSDADVRIAFDRVSRSYHAVRDEVEHSDSREARADLQPVTDDYADVERALQGYTTRPMS